MRGVTGWKHHLDDQQSAAEFHRTATVTENCQTLVFAPIVDDMRQQVGISSRGNTHEETARFDPDVGRQSARLNQCGRVANHMRHVEENASRTWILSEY